jgi:hypothetical protein
MAQPAAAQIITIGRSEHPEWVPSEILGWHVESQEWWSSSQHHGRIWKNMWAFVRFVPGGQLIARARFIDPDPEYHEEGPEPDLHWLWHPVEFVDSAPLTGVYLRDFGITGWRARPGIIGITSAEREAIAHALGEAAGPETTDGN